jgi:hypothetical protein
MTQLGNILLAGKPATADAPGSTSIAQLKTIPNNPNRDYGVSAVQGKGPDGQVYSGQLIQRVYGSGEVRFYLKGEGNSHPLPATITSAGEAKVYARQQITKGTWSDLPLGNQAAFKNTSSNPTPAAAMGNIPTGPAFDKGVGPVQGKAPNGKVLTGDLIMRVYSTGYVRYYFKGQNDSHKLPPSITTTADARDYARKQISSGKWTDFNPGDQAAFNPSRPSSKVTGAQTPEKQKFPSKLAVDFGSPTPSLKVGSVVVGDRPEIVAVNKAKLRGYSPDSNNPRYISFSNDAKGGKDLAEVNFSAVSYDKTCNPSTNCEIVGFNGFQKFDNKGLVVPKGASPEFMDSYKKTAKLYGQNF